MDLDQTVNDKVMAASFRNELEKLAVYGQIGKGIAVAGKKLVEWGGKKSGKLGRYATKAGEKARMVGKDIGGRNVSKAQAGLAGAKDIGGVGGYTKALGGAKKRQAIARAALTGGTGLATGVGIGKAL